MQWSMDTGGAAAFCGSTTRLGDCRWTRRSGYCRGRGMGLVWMRVVVNGYACFVVVVWVHGESSL